jgi:hypothetical protein
VHSRNPLGQDYPRHTKPSPFFILPLVAVEGESAKPTRKAALRGKAIHNGGFIVVPIEDVHQFGDAEQIDKSLVGR